MSRKTIENEYRVCQIVKNKFIQCAEYENLGDNYFLRHFNKYLNELISGDYTYDKACIIEQYESLNNIFYSLIPKASPEHMVYSLYNSK